MTRHVLGVLGVIAASVLLVVSAMMNYRFGFSLGKTPGDGHIYGLASAAADCFKALVPFFFFAAWRNRMWSQALAAALVWIVVVGYSMTSALGHAALNRMDVSGKRAVASANYQDLRADIKRAKEQLSWIPAHRPPETVAAELNVVKAQRFWIVTRECSRTVGPQTRGYCQHYHKLSAELASGRQAQQLEERIAQGNAKAADTSGGTAMAVADPQASVLARMSGVPLEKVQMGLTVFVALLIEIGSGFGMYVAFAYWRMYAPALPAPRAPPVEVQPRPALPGRVDEVWATEVEGPDTQALTLTQSGSAEGANDNGAASRWIMPENDVELFYKQGVSISENETICSQDLYDGYKLWSKGKDKRPLNHSRFSADFERLGYTTVQIGGRQRYVGLALTAELQTALEKKPSFRKRKAAEAPEQIEEATVDRPAAA